MESVMLVVMPGGLEIALIIFVAFLIFGTTRVPKMIGGLGKAMREFREGWKGGIKDGK